MKIVEVTLYEFDELSDKAKEKARDWWRESEIMEFGGDDTLYEPAETAAKLLGIDFAQREVKLMSGKSRYDSDIRWSGFSSQGDGLSFVGSYAYREGGVEAVKAEFGTDEELWRIAAGLVALQEKYGHKLEARITQSGHYLHKYTMSLESSLDLDSEAGEVEVPEDDDKALLDLMRDFADWIYKGLRAEYDYRLSDENVDESIRANEYTFRENGKRSDG